MFVKLSRELFQQRNGLRHRRIRLQRLAILEYEPHMSIIPDDHLDFGIHFLAVGTLIIEILDDCDVPFGIADDRRIWVAEDAILAESIVIS